MAEANMILSKAALDENEDLLTCGICKEIFTDPKQLPCVHCFCNNCLQLMTSNTDCKLLRCPVCCREFQIPGRSVTSFRNNEYLRNFSELFKARKEEDLKEELGCSICNVSKKTEHLSHCLECDDNLCKNCEESHNKFKKLTRGHNVVPYQEYLDSHVIMKRSKSFCKVHPNNMLNLYCSLCDDCLCSKCLYSHQEFDDDEAESCRIISLSDMRKSLVRSWNEKLHSLKEVIQVYENEVRHADRVQQKLNKSRENICEEIQTEADRLITGINEQKDSHLIRLDEAFRNDEMAVNLHREKSERIIESANHLLKFQEHVIKFGDDREVIDAINMLEGRLTYFTQAVDYLEIVGKFQFVTENENISMGTIQKKRIDVCENRKTLSNLNIGDRVHRGSGWKAGVNDYQYQTGTIVSKSESPSTELEVVWDGKPMEKIKYGSMWNFPVAPYTESWCNI